MGRNATAGEATDVVAFWKDAGPDKWFAKDDQFDAEFRERFYDLHFRAARRECADWLADTPGALALIILLDQFPRNVFRNSGHMYATDPLARAYARTAIINGFDIQTDPMLRGFFYLPFGHSEDVADQNYAVELCRGIGGPWLEHAEGHCEIVTRFGRFPHRNPILGRASFEDELKFLDEGGFAG